jgi:hypothetical protein
VAGHVFAAISEEKWKRKKFNGLIQKFICNQKNAETFDNSILQAPERFGYVG